ncbi:MAG TPA: plastocyanin/azurin family copper-binding protein [Solirubrobacterales bacterium]
MDGDLFYVIGVILVLAAVVLSFLGVRSAGSFPQNRVMLIGVTALFATIVGVTMAFAIDLSEEEQAHREQELAQEEQEAEAPPRSPGGQPQASEGGNQQDPETAQATSLAVTSPEDGGLAFEPDGLEASPGNLTITYTNPSAVPHSLALETNDGNVLGETSVFTDGEESVELQSLAPGEYVFFCTVPGHREAGMEGDLTVEGNPPVG